MTQRILHEHTIRAGEYIIFTFMRYDSILMKVASVWHNCYTEKKENNLYALRETQEGKH